MADTAISARAVDDFRQKDDDFLRRHTRQFGYGFQVIPAAAQVHQVIVIVIHADTSLSGGYLFAIAFSCSSVMVLPTSGTKPNGDQISG